MKVLGRDQFGDLYVHVQIAVPNKLTSEQREKLIEFSKALGENNSPLHESFFAKAKKFFGSAHKNLCLHGRQRFSIVQTRSSKSLSGSCR